MSEQNPKEIWESYCKEELASLSPILEKHNITLDEEQKHISGERYLMQAVTTTSGRKLILTGVYNGTTSVIIKATREEGGKKEIEHERNCRAVLHAIDFAAEVFHSPPEILYSQENNFTIIVTEFIDQEIQFTDRPTTEQFQFALRAFKGQEGAHATTAKHMRVIKNTFEVRCKDDYLTMFESFKENISNSPEGAGSRLLLEKAYKELKSQETIIDQYTGFLTHTDFVPHNIRIKDNTIYLLDHSSLTFGNKYEGWARFLNFMVLYNQELENWLVEYVKLNRTQEETTSLRMMRVYRLGEIIWYYVRATQKSVGDLNTLNSARITFWSEILRHTLEDTPVPPDVTENYKNTRDSLRSEDEKKRQKGLH